MRTLALIVVLCCAPLAEASERVLRVFDFEERSLGNRERVPIGWRRVVGAGFPHYVQGKLQRTTQQAPALRGDWSFRMDLDGGSVAYRLDPHLLTVKPGVRYRVEAGVKTQDVRHAAATVEAYFADEAGRMVPGTRTTSPIHRGDWQRRAVELVAPPEAHSLVLQIGLYQANKLDAVDNFRDIAGDLGRALRLDVTGSAWFDDVVVTRVPSVVLDTPVELQMFPAGKRPALRLAVIDERTDDLTGHVVVRDMAGNEVHRRSGPMPTLTGTDPTLIPLPELRPGYYEAELLVTAAEHDETLLLRRTLGFACMAEPGGRVSTDARFGFDMSRLSAASVDRTIETLPDFGIGTVVLPVWSDDGFANKPELMKVLMRLQQLDVDAAACLMKPTTARDWSDAGGDDRWHEPLAEVAARHATLMRRWQIGDIETADLWPADPQRKRAYRRAQGILRPLLGTDRVSMPWPIWYEPIDIPGDEPALTLRVPTGVLPGQIPLYLDDLRDHAAPRELTLSLDVLDADAFGSNRQWRDMVLRIGYAVAADADRVLVRLPIVERDGIRQPTPITLPMRTVFSELSGATFVGEIPLAPLTRGFLYDNGGKDRSEAGVMMVWAENESEDIELDVAVGGVPVLVDLLGNRMPLEVVDGRVRFTVTQQPCFVVGVDLPVCELRMSTRFDNPLVEARFGDHMRTLNFTNPHDYHMTGSFDIVGPGGWEIEPLQRRFQLGPGESAEVPVRIRFPFNSAAGRQTATVRFNFDGGDLDRLDVPVDLRIGLSDVSISSMAFLDRGTLVVQQVITNYGDTPINYNSFVVAPGHPRQERLVLDLAPGSSTIKRYRFPAFVGPADLRSGLYELDGDRVLNERLRVE